MIEELLKRIEELEKRIHELEHPWWGDWKHPECELCERRNDAARN